MMHVIRPLSSLHPVTPVSFAVNTVCGGAGYIPVFTADATGVGSQGLLDVYMPGVTLTGLGGGDGVLDTVFPTWSITATEWNTGRLDASIPQYSGEAFQLWDSLDKTAPTFEMLEGRCGWIIEGNIPVPTCTASGTHINTGILISPAPVMTAEIRTGAVDSFEIPIFKGEAAGKVGYIGGLNKEIPEFTSSIVAGASATCSFPITTMSGTGVSDNNGNININSPVFSATTLSGTQGYVGNVNAKIPQIAITASGISSLIATLNKNIPVFSADASGVNGLIGRARGDIPTFSASAVIYSDDSGDIDSLMPQFELFGIGSLSTIMDDEILGYSRC